MSVSLPKKHIEEGFTLPKTLTDVSLSSEVIILDMRNPSLIKKRATYRELKKEWRDCLAFTKRLT